jgi:16S rRNA (guanine(966)-N(2))-methyltransferase RsmD
MVRVIAGRYKSRLLKTLAGERLRPTSDRLRETLFNVLGESVVGAVFVDLYAGSGAVGIEAASRGAEWVYFIESHRPAARLMEANLMALGIESGAEILAVDALAGLRQLEQRSARLDIVYLDPPYREAKEYERALSHLGLGTLLVRSGVVVAEHHPKQPPAERYGLLVRHRTLRQGNAVLSFYRLV